MRVNIDEHETLACVFLRLKLRFSFESSSIQITNEREEKSIIVNNNGEQAWETNKSTRDYFGNVAFFASFLSLNLKKGQLDSSFEWAGCGESERLEKAEKRLKYNTRTLFRNQ